MAWIFARPECDAVLSEQPQEHWKRLVAVTRALRLEKQREQRDVMLDERRLVA